MELTSESLSSPESAGGPSAHAAGDVDFLRFLRGRGRPELEAMLRCIQHRLGTAAERPKDIESAQHVAHQLNNLRSQEVLAEELERFGKE